MNGGREPGQHRLECEDGSSLNILVHRPDAFDAPCSSILVVTPYGARRYQQDGRFFSAAGFVMVVVDALGCGASSGVFTPFEHAGESVRQAARWVTAQAWSNGRVGLYGGSYSGFVQWAACTEPVAGLLSLAPVASVYPGVDFPAVNGLMYLYASRWLAYMDNRARDDARYLDNDYWDRSLRQVSLSNPAALITAAVGQSGTLQRWLACIGDESWWQSLSPSKAQMAQVDVPALFITGTYDDDQRGTLAYYKQMSEAQRNRSVLIIGPWDHDGTRRPRAEYGGLVHGPESCTDLLELHRQWYAYTLDGAVRPDLCRSAVRYYMAGSERWHECDSLPGMSDQCLTLYFDGQRGLVREPATQTGVSTIVSGGQSPIGNVMGHEPMYRAHVDLLEHAAGAAFTSATLEHPLPLCGAPQVILNLRAAHGADVCVTLYALLPDHTAVYLGASNRRIDAYRQGLAQDCVFDSFNLICRELPAASSLRIIVSLSDPTRWLSDNDPLTHVELRHGTDFSCTLSLPLQSMSARSELQCPIQ